MVEKPDTRARVEVCRIDGCHPITVPCIFNIIIVSWGQRYVPNHWKVEVIQSSGLPIAGIVVDLAFLLQQTVVTYVEYAPLINRVRHESSTDFQLSHLLTGIVEICHCG